MKTVSVLVWAVCSALTLSLLTLPTGAHGQLALAVAVLCCALVLKRFRRMPVLRQVFLALATFLIIRYIYWRLSSTLPSFQNFTDWTAAIIVLAAEAFCISMLFLGVFVNLNPLRRRPAPIPRDTVPPTVDVFVPSYNEDDDLVAATLAAAKAMDYPPDRLVVYLLDDGGTDEKCNSPDPFVAANATDRRRRLRDLCARLGVEYLARSRNLSAKAGNLNNGLAHSAGELVVVFDADHAPYKEFLRETVGHFLEDERLFLVQTPHFFLNPDPIEKNLGTFSSMPSENEMFYGAVQRGLDSWNSAFFCGSAAVLRRSALAEVDGFAGVTITEDCETALELHARGWNSRYVDKPMIAGLQPETFASFIGQRSRWCKGMIQILLLKNPLTKRGLSIPQRLCYTSSAMFWLFPLPRMVFVIAPLLYIFFDMKIYVASAQEFISYTVPYLIAMTLMHGYLFGNLRWPWISELYEYVQSIYLLRAVASVVANPRAPSFTVTKKGDTVEEGRLSELALPYYVVVGVLLLGIVVAVFRYQSEPASQTLLLVVGGWNLFNLILAALALGCVSERRERRRAPRVPITRTAELLCDDAAYRIVVEAASLNGLEFRLLNGSEPAPAFAHGQRACITLSDPKSPQEHPLRLPVVLVRSCGSNRAFAVRFCDPATDRHSAIARLIYSDGSRLMAARSARQTGRNIAVWSMELSLRALHQLGRGFGYAISRKAAKADYGAGAELSRQVQ